MPKISLPQLERHLLAAADTEEAVRDKLAALKNGLMEELLTGRVPSPSPSPRRE